MLTLLKQPNPIVQTKNPVVYKIQTDNYILTNGVYAVSGFIAFSSPPVGATLTFVWGSNSLTFTFATALDSSGLKIRTNTFGYSTSDYVNKVLIPDLESNNILYNAFSVKRVNPNKVVFTALNPGSEYTLGISYTGLSTSLIASTAGVDKTTRNNFKVFCELYTTDLGGANLNKVITVEQEPDSANSVVFDFSTQLDNLIKSQKPSTSQTKNDGTDLYALSTVNAIKYFIRYGESYGVPSVDYITQTTKLNTAAGTGTDNWAILGGVDKKTFPNYSFYTDVTTNKNRLLTTQPTTRVVSKNSPIIINYLVVDPTENYCFEFTFYYSDGTSAVSSMSGFAPTYQYGINIIPIHYSVLEDRGIIDIDKDLIRFDVIVKNLVTLAALSQKLTYIFDDLTYAYERYFLYENSMGTYDILRCVGPQTVAGQFNSDGSLKILSYDYTSETQEEISFNSTKKEGPFKISTGYQRQDLIDSLRDFFLSNNVYLISEENEHIPISITTTKPQFPGDDDTLYAIQFEYEYKFTDKAYNA
jgi:hypothetical protein